MTPRILFVHNSPTKFVQIDQELLRNRYSVREWYQRTRAVNLAELTKAIAQSDLIFGWFASWHTFLPVLVARVLKRPSILVVGGYDTARMPEIGYGSQRGGIKRWIARTAMNSANAVITHSFYTRDEAVRNAGVDRGKVTLIYLGLEANDSPEKGQKEKLVITVGNVDRTNLRRKGLEPFVRAAALLPEIPFVVIGAWRDDSIRHLRDIASPNVQFTGWVGDETLREYLMRARVYVQASRHEGFGLSLAEAMLSRCIPVVTRSGALPEVVGESGIYAEEPEAKTLADCIRRALTLDDGWGSRARQRIVNEFPVERRRDGLLSLVERVLAK